MYSKDAVLNSTADKLIQPASAPVEEDIIALAVVDFELMICTVSVPRSCNDIQVIFYAVLYVFYFKPAEIAVIGNGGIFEFVGTGMIVVQL